MKLNQVTLAHFFQIDETSNPEEHYLRLYENGIGTKVADFYISWAFHYDISGNMKRANAVYRKGRSLIVVISYSQTQLSIF